MNNKNFVVGGSTHSIMSAIKTLYSLVVLKAKVKSQILDI